jgi:hypothetical protein
MAGSLFDFAFFPNWDGCISFLSRCAQKENWNYRHFESKANNPVLRNYLTYTFKRIQEQDKLRQTGAFACFNTGLVSENYEEIFALFQENKMEGRQPYFFKAFLKESERPMLQFGQLPDLASYVSDPKDLVYDFNMEIRLDLDHIINENRDRFPVRYQSQEDNYDLRIALDGAKQHAIRRAKRNYRTAVPQFYRGRIQLLLPICMGSRNSAVLALAIQRQEDVYLASTCLTLDMAYNNARLLTQPNSDWLEP